MYTKQEFYTIFVKREELEKALEINSRYISLGIESCAVGGQRILWASNGNWGDKRVVIHINE